MNRLILKIIMLVYTMIWWLLSLFIPLIFLYRLWKGKEHKKKYLQKFGVYHDKRPKGNLLWVHGASVGETRSNLLVLRKLMPKLKDWHCILTTTTVSSYFRYQHELPNNVKHVFIPLDHPMCVKAFFKHWSPNAVIWCEQELWPNLLNKIKAKVNGPKILIQARFSDKSFKHWNYYPKFIQHLCNTFSLIYCQSPLIKERLASLGVYNTVYDGNLKKIYFHNKHTQTNSSIVHKISNFVKKTPSWTALSLHQEEFKAMLKCHLRLCEKHPSLVGLWVLRHPDTMENLKKLASNLGVKVLSWANEQPIEDKQIRVWHKIGGIEAVLEQKSNICIIGGSFESSIGGHNPYEALSFNKVTIFGPHMENFNYEAKDLCSKGKAIQVKDLKELINKIDYFLTSKKAVKAVQVRIQDNKEKSTILDSIVYRFSNLVEVI